MFRALALHCFSRGSTSVVHFGFGYGSRWCISQPNSSGLVKLERGCTGRAGYTSEARAPAKPLWREATSGRWPLHGECSTSKARAPSGGVGRYSPASLVVDLQMPSGPFHPGYLRLGRGCHSGLNWRVQDFRWTGGSPSMPLSSHIRVWPDACRDPLMSERKFDPSECSLQLRSSVDVQWPDSLADTNSRSWRHRVFTWPEFAAKPPSVAGIQLAL